MELEFDEVKSRMNNSKHGTTLSRQRRVNVDFPEWMITSLDREARRLGVTRQPVIKIWIAERLERKVS